MQQHMGQQSQLQERMFTFVLDQQQHRLVEGFGNGQVVANEARMPSAARRANATDPTPPPSSSPPTVSGHDPASRPLPPLQQATPSPTPTPTFLTQADTTPNAYLACIQGDVEGEEEGLEEEGVEEEIPAADFGKGIRCPALHDGLACWPSTAGGMYALVPCPASFTLHPNTTKRASRYCGQDGEWEPDAADYLACATDDIFTKAVEVKFLA
ncbi:calcitonin receptor-like [Penaeus chinensis]|uniref:calcitonin receptor-like n=1 Tax=Penaeus chinensis TaxID=139456 RepID=UPI001FB6EF50|nr:calcitonin receptor-like [Penaeus chinensis]